MLFKLSLKNIKKSIKDYSIYFFTLVFAVCMFYSFNSIDAQTSMLKLTESKIEIVEALVCVIGYVSVFVSVILGFLIVYSNNFLIKKRKKEIGLYFTLGMSKRKVSLILVIETILIGLISLVVGILCGIGLSQFISLITARLFEADMTGFKFIFSSVSFTKTILYFGIIFLLVMIFSVFTLSRYKLIDLINANKKIESIKIRNKYLTIITFILSVLLIGYAYYLLFDNALVMMNNKTLLMIIFGSIGTFLLFYSLSGFLLKVIQKLKGVYYKDLNMFTLKQINSKINTTVVSTTIICLMLLLTIGILSSSISLSGAFNKDIESNNLTDYTVIVYDTIYYDDVDGYGIADEIKGYDVMESSLLDSNLKDYSKEHVLVHFYGDKNIIARDLMTEKSVKMLQKKYGSALSLNFSIPIIKESEYKELMRLQGKNGVDINEDEYLLLVNVDFAKDAFTPYHESGKGIVINNRKLRPATDLIETAVENCNSACNDGVVVVSDNLITDQSVIRMKLMGNFVKNEDVEQLENEFYDFLVEKEMVFTLNTRTYMEAASIGTSAMITFIGLYLGITFAISSATILAIGQLSSSSDNKNRYRVLKQLGANNRMINKALFMQISTIFSFPLVVALIHSYFGLREVNNLIIVFGDVDLTSNIILTTLFMIIVYGGYFAVTYLCSKNIIKEN